MYLFVYGTLRRSAAQSMHRLLHPAEFIGFGRFQGKLYDLGTYPAAVASAEPADLVLGEVYLLAEPAATLATLDRYEGCSPDDPLPHEYYRAAADVVLEQEGDPAISAQIYLYKLPTNRLTRIERGDYLEWVARKGPPAPDGN